MSRRVTGILTNPSGEPIVGAVIRFTAKTTSLSGVPQTWFTEVRTVSGGLYDINLSEGSYKVTASAPSHPSVDLGDCVVDTGNAVTLSELLGASAVPLSLGLDLLSRVEALEAIPPGSAGVVSVNGDSGPVVELTAEDVGADPEGTASLRVGEHTDAADPHPGKYDTSGSASAVANALSSHEAEQEGAHGMPDPGTIVTSESVAGIEWVAEYPAEPLPDVVYIVAPAP